MNLFRWIAAAWMLGGCQSPERLLPYPLTITQEGLGPIHLGGAFDIALLRGKFPGFDLDTLSQVNGEQSGTIVRLKRHDEPIALIVSDSRGKTVVEVIILSSLVKNTRGLGINDVLIPANSLHCINNTCRNASEPSLTYRIDPKTNTILEITLQQL